VTTSDLEQSLVSNARESIGSHVTSSHRNYKNSLFTRLKSGSERNLTNLT